jgi:class 3 adenylate cyclase
VPDGVGLAEGTSRSDQHQRVRAIDEWWGGTVYFHITAPSLTGDRALLKRLARQLRHQASPGTAQAILTMLIETDTRAILPTIGVPTLVLHAAGNVFFPATHGRYLAEQIPGARFVEIAASDHLWWSEDPDAFLDEIEHFVTGVRRGADPDRVLATVLFTDIVDSTRMAADLGDQHWREVLERHQRVVREHLDHFNGREVKSTGDGFLATFDGPARAIRCASAILRSSETSELRVRAGLHTGECETMGDDIGGIAVHIAARVSAQAEPQELLVSRTVKDLVAGSGLQFTDRGVHTLKGVPDTWQLYAVHA